MKIKATSKAVASKVPLGNPKQPRTISFTMPQLPRPTIRRPRLPRTGAVVAVVLGVLIAGLAGYAGSWLERSHNDFGLNTTQFSGQKKIVTGESQLITRIAKNLGPSVVSVNVSLTTTSAATPDMFGFAPPQQQQAEAAGTGIIISSKGLIITNRHVVPIGTTKVSITLSDGTQLKDVTVVGRTSENDSLDVAFLKVGDTKGHSLVPAAIGDSATAQVGDNVVAIGNALGQFQNTVTSGIVSGFGRSIVASDSVDGSSGENLADLIQTDAAINSGNSGGPLVNLNGQVIGINTAVAGGSAQNIGFAIPVNDLKGLITQVLKTGKFERPYLGVHYIVLTADIAYQYNLPVNNGAYLVPSNSDTPTVIANSPADKAGLHEKDIITAIDDVKLDQTHSLVSVVGQHIVGDKVTLTIVRGDQNLKIDVMLEAAPSSNP